MRFAIFAERVAPLLADIDAVTAMSDHGLDLTAKARLGNAKIAAAKEAANIRALLAPED